MTFRNRRKRAQNFAWNKSNTNDARLFERLQRHRARRNAVSRPLLACLMLLWFFRKQFITVREHTFQSAVIDSNNRSLQQQNVRKLYFQDSAVVPGPETVVIGRKNQWLVLTEHGTLVELLMNNKNKKTLANTDHQVVETKVWKDLGIGRPLGGRFTPHEKNTLYIADAALGLTRLRNFNNPKSHVELVANTVTVWMMKDGTNTYESPLFYVNSVAVGPKTGNVYFTDSSDIAPDRIYKHGHWVWDTLYASKLDLIRGIATGRVCEYNIKTKQVRVLADQIHFANGIAVDPVSEEWLVVAETFGTRLLQYDLSKATTNTDLFKPSEYLQPKILVDADQMTGYVDNVDCAVLNKTSTCCFGAIVNSFAPIHRFLMKLPQPFEQWVRSLLWHLPRSMAPRVVPSYTGVVRVHMETGSIDYIQDPTASHVQMISGVTVHKNELYLGSLTNDHIVVYNMDGESSS